MGPFALEAAFEARLERLRRLHGMSTRQDDRLEVRRGLETALEEFDSDHPWWSMGRAQLAKYYFRAEEEPDARIRAREAALTGLNRHPESVGAEQCQWLVSKIEEPEVAIRTMVVDAAGKRSIQISHANVSRVYLRAWKRDREALVEGRFGDRHRGDRESMTREDPAATWFQDLPDTGDYGKHVTYATIPGTLPPGAYLIGVSAREDFGDRENEVYASDMIVGDIVLVVHQFEDVWEVTALSGETGQPLDDVDVQLYRSERRDKTELVDQRRTRSDGRLEFPRPEPGGYYLFAERGEEVGFQERLGSSRHRERSSVASAFLYTDRSVYRPGQRVQWKVVAYGADQVGPPYQTLRGTRGVVELRDSSGDVVESIDVVTNDFGSADGEFVVPSGRLLGRWSIRASFGGQVGFRVEEYKRPTFEVELADPADALRLNRPARLEGTARYYFGLPVVSGDVEWSVSRAPLYPGWWWWRTPSSRDVVIASGETTLSQDGTFDLAFTPTADEREASQDGVTYKYRVDISVTDDGGETRSSTRDFRLGFVSVEARIGMERQFLRSDEATQLEVTRVDLNGTPRAGSGSWRLAELVQPTVAVLPGDLPADIAPGDLDPYRTAGDSLRPRWDTRVRTDQVVARWPEGKVVRSGATRHEADGTATVELSGLAPGAYRLLYETQDEFGATCRARRELLVVGKTQTPVALPLILVAERNTVPVGDTARVFVRSALPDQRLEFEIYRDGKRLDHRFLRSGHHDELIEIPITEDDRGGFVVKVSTLRDYQFLTEDVMIFVPWSDRELDVEFATFRDELRPHGKETFRVSVRGHDGTPVDSSAAELLAYMYDRSLDVFGPHRPPEPIRIYPRWSGSVSVENGLGSTRMMYVRGRRSGEKGPFIPHGDQLRWDRRGEPFVAFDLGKAKGLGAGEVSETPIGGTAYLASALAVPDEITIPGLPRGGEDALVVGRPALSPASFDAFAPPGPQEPAVELRTDFSETAFFYPQLHLDDEGVATIEFEVPDAVTDWNVWVHALTRDLRSGSAHRQARTIKELLVRPYLPRFLREGDAAVIEVLVQNAGDQPLAGTLDFAIQDPETDEDLRSAFGLGAAASTGVPFSVEPQGSASLSFPVAVPPRVGSVVFQVTAQADGFSDGERRPVPILPGRFHLVESKFAALRNEAKRELHFGDLEADDDPTRIQDQMVVTVDAQLFYGVLSALPYLIDYPYECTEQTLNRFVSTTILSKVYEESPSLAGVAEDLSQRSSQSESWNAPDPNRKIALEETPWLVTSRGGTSDADRLINVLDPRIAKATRDGALAQLERAQTPSGGFSWWPGGEASPYMTLYVFHGLAKAAEFGVDLPGSVTKRAWQYLHQYYVNDLLPTIETRDCCWETLTFLAYVLSSVPEDASEDGFRPEDREEVLGRSFAHWRELSPLLKGYLAVALSRAGRKDDAHLVWESVMDAAHHDEDLGTYWAPEDRAWLWYNDRIETHAFALRTLMELNPDDERRYGLVQWLFLNKKLDHWESTRATAEVIYALVPYLKHEGALEAEERVDVAIGPVTRTMRFEPGASTGGQNHVVIPGDEIDPKTMSRVQVEKDTPGFAFASATWHYSTERLPSDARGDLFHVTRRYFRRVLEGDEWTLRSLRDGDPIAVGDQIEVQLTIRASHEAEYVHLRDPRAAGFEPETTTSRHKWDRGLGYYEEIRDSGANFFFERLPAGEYVLRHRIRANLAGEFRVAAATLQSMYAPEFTGFSTGDRLVVR